MRDAPSPLVRRQDYTAPAYRIRSVELVFDLDPARTLVTNRMTIVRNAGVPVQPLRLHGEDITLTRLQLDGASVSFRHEDGELVIDATPDGEFVLEVRNTCSPDKNTQLSGLYTSGGGFFTQCEAEGFRRITYFVDRPDVMAVYTVTLRAPKAAYPVLLSNGNLVEQGDLDGGRHYARWHDPFPKPSYLFALVAADLVAREQHVRTRAGKDHLLQVWVRRGDLEKTEHAMASLVASVVWDEARFGLTLDLERFMIVAVGDFNMGAMENKGLNIFNTRFVLANPTTATDADYADIESVVGHEYFHNWTGNRVTCRDWFQLSLKEGLTVFRDQEFSQDMRGPADAAPGTPAASARAVRRIQDVRDLRESQFPEDAGPMAHPVRPDAYAEINNFYTATVYDKGAEVVRMMHALVGRDGFAAGLRLYFERHDGQAVTCDDFAQAMADANPGSELQRRLENFKRWYAQAGTPHVRATGAYDPIERSYRLELSQHCPPSPGQPDKQPFVIPVMLGLVGRSGHALPLRLQGERTGAAAQRLVVLADTRASWTFVDIDEPPVPSLLRGFSAPVVLEDDLGDAELLTLLQHDGDPFNRWEAGQRLALKRLLDAVRGTGGTLDHEFVEAMRAVLRHPTLDAAFKELVLTPPPEAYVAEQFDVVDPPRIHAARQSMLRQLAVALRHDWAWAWEAHQVAGAYTPDPVSAGRRALANLALHMLCLSSATEHEPVWPGRAYQRCKDAGNMTERLGALSALIDSHAELAPAALERFHAQFRHEPLVIDKWFAMQATAPEHEGRVFAQAKALMQHADFRIDNPNRARALILALCARNPSAFHRSDGAGYAFWADRVLQLDAINPQVASRLARVMDRWSRLAAPYRDAARRAIERVAAHDGLSADVREVVSRALESTPQLSAAGSAVPAP